MEIEHIREFVSLTETRNFAETAERFFTSQSTISKHLKSLEAELGETLFHRTSRRVELSEFGELFLPYAKSILEIQYQYTTAFYNKREHIRDTLTIGSLPVMAQYGITDVIVRFKRENTHFILDVLEEEAKDLKTLIRQGKCELAFVRDTGEADKDFIKIPYATDSMAVVLPADHRLAHRETVELKELEKEDFLFIREKTHMYDLCMKSCEAAGFQPNVVFTGHRLENIIDFVIKGMGISLLMRRQVMNLAPEKVAVVEITPAIKSRIQLIYLKDRPLSAGARHFISCMNGGV